MPQHLAPLALASVQQLRHALGRLTALHAHSAPPPVARPEQTAASHTPRTRPLPAERAEWAETCADVRHIRA